MKIDLDNCEPEQLEEFIADTQRGLLAKIDLDLKFQLGYIDILENQGDPRYFMETIEQEQHSLQKAMNDKYEPNPEKIEIQREYLRDNLTEEEYSALFAIGDMVPFSGTPGARSAPSREAVNKYCDILKGIQEKFSKSEFWEDFTVRMSPNTLACR